MIRKLLLLTGAILLGACARSPVVVTTPDLPERVELVEVPFFPQDAYQCGPAALATMLTHRGVDTDPEQLVGRVYLPERKGSLQVEMVAAARAHDLLVYPLEPRLDALLAEVAAGNPVLVLQNLAFDRWPQWHFAVVVGYDLESQTFILRSGTTERWTGSFRQFERSWIKGNRWAVVTIAPDRLPAGATETVWLKAANDLEQTGREEAALKAYRTATRHWNGGLSWFALANSLYAKGDSKTAESALRSSIASDEGFAVGWFNLAQVLAERGCEAQAFSAKACAMQLAPEDKRFAASLSPQREQGAVCAPLPRCPAD